MFSGLKNVLPSLNSSDSILSIDIGTKNIVIAQIAHTRNSVNLSHFNYVELPEGCLGDDGQLKNLDTLMEALKEAYKSGVFEQKKAVISVWGASVITKRITVPKVESHMMETQIRFEAENYIPFDINNVYFDYVEIGESSQENSVDMIIAAILDTQLLEFLEIVEKSGLKCAIMDIPSFALSNCYFYNYPDAGQETVLLLNIGHSYTNFVIFKGEKLLFCRDLPLGGHVYTSEIQKKMGASFSEAESAKLKVLTEGSDFEQYQEAFDAASTFIASEVEEVVSYFKEAYSSLYEPMSRCFLTGGSSGVPGLEKALADSLGFETEKFDPFRKLSWGGKLLTPQYIDEIRTIAAPAIGLALRKD